MNYYPGDIVTDLEGKDRYRVINDNGDTLDVELDAGVEGQESAVLECEKNLFSLVKRPLNVYAYRFMQTIESLLDKLGG